MYELLLILHSICRWLILLGLPLTIVLSIHGAITQRAYTTLDAIARISISAISHLQLLLGCTLYFLLSPITKSFITNGIQGSSQLAFFGIYHGLMMTVAVIIMTIGSALARREKENKRKFKLSIIYFSIALVLILAAIPWFRPYFRPF